MPLYLYKCKACKKLVEIDHPMDAVDDVHPCPTCGRALVRKLTPIVHRWPAQYYPGLEHSGQRTLLDPENQARWKADLDRMKEDKSYRPDVKASKYGYKR